jgi:tRNA(Ile)-lysidine synthase
MESLAAVISAHDPGLLGRTTFASKGEPVSCAVSGGPDSLALLALAIAAGCEVTAYHVDHGLRPGSSDEADVARDAARRLGARFHAVRVDVAAGPNLEARARQARRAVLPGDVATGHTLDDQAETVLINLLRGAGASGLRGMRPGPAHPLLSLRRAETHALTAILGFEPVEDPSNADPRFVRNRVRHELLPLANLVAGRDVAPILARQAVLLGEEADYLDRAAAGIDGRSVAELRRVPRPLARRAVRCWLTLGGSPPSAAAVERVLAVVDGKARGCAIEGGTVVRRSSGRLLRLPAPGVRDRGEERPACPAGPMGTATPSDRALLAGTASSATVAC